MVPNDYCLLLVGIIAHEELNVQQKIFHIYQDKLDQQMILNIKFPSTPHCEKISRKLQLHSDRQPPFALTLLFCTICFLYKHAQFHTICQIFCLFVPNMRHICLWMLKYWNMAYGHNNCTVFRRKLFYFISTKLETCELLHLGKPSLILWRMAPPTYLLIFWLTYLLIFLCAYLHTYEDINWLY